MAAEVRFADGELIFHEGDHSSLFYVLLSGNVALEVMASGRPVRVATLYAGEVLGWSSVTGDNGKQFQARALEDVHALAFDGARLCHACEAGFRVRIFLLARGPERDDGPAARDPVATARRCTRLSVPYEHRGHSRARGRSTGASP